MNTHTHHTCWGNSAYFCQDLGLSPSPGCLAQNDQLIGHASHRKSGEAMTHAHIPIFYNLPKKPPYQGAKGLSSSPEHPFLPLRINPLGPLQSVPVLVRQSA